MGKNLTRILIQFIFILGASSAQARFEGRLSYGFLNADPNLQELCSTCVGNIPSQAMSYGFGADALFQLPWTFAPMVGARYENMAATAGAGGVDIKSELTRISLLLHQRWTYSLFYFGPTATYGLSHSTSLKSTEGSTLKGSFSPKSYDSYSLGLEGGLKLNGFSLGAEVGYLQMTWNDATDSTGNAPIQDIKMSGAYAKFILGFSI